MTAAARTTSRSDPGHHADTRLPWWAVALPVIGFLALLLLLMASGRAEAADERAGSTVDDRAVTRVLKQFERALPG